MRRLKRPRALTVVLALLAPILLVVGVWLGSHPSHLPGFARGIFVDRQRQVVLQAYGVIEHDYVKSVPRGKLADAAINGMVSSLPDQFSAYYTPHEWAQYEQSSDNELTGIGTAVHGTNAGLRVLRVYDGSPAKRAGLKAGDLITEVDGRSLRGVAETKAVGWVKGREGSEVRLTVRRGARTFERVVTRAVVTVPTVSSRMIDSRGHEVGYLALDQFTNGSHGEVISALRALRAKGAQGLVFDLRSNPGGFVREAQLVASAFLKQGVIVSTRGRTVAPETLQATGDPVAADLPMVVLVNRGTASAAEIVTGALKDSGRAEVVGTRTFGKGVFQEVLPLLNGGGMSITVGQYFTPNGTNLGKGLGPGRGLQPQVHASDDPKTARDEALDVALTQLDPKLR